MASASSRADRSRAVFSWLSASLSASSFCFSDEASSDDRLALSDSFWSRVSTCAGGVNARDECKVASELWFHSAHAGAHASGESEVLGGSSFSLSFTLYYVRVCFDAVPDERQTTRGQQ